MIPAGGPGMTYPHEADMSLNRAVPDRDRDIATRRQKLLLVAGSLLAGLLIAELVIALVGLAPEVGPVERGRFRLSDNPKIGYEPIPGVVYGDQDLAFYDYRGRSNSLGFRDREHAIEKVPGTFRIIVLGDSVAAGLKVAKFEDTYPAQMERLLRRTDPSIEVISLAVSGYNTQQEVETLRIKGLQMSPDLVVLAYCLNDTASFTDLLDALLAKASEGDRVLPPSLESTWLVKSALYRFVRYRALPLITGRDGSVRAEDYAELARDTVEVAFGELAGIARDSGFEVLVTVFPTFGDLDEYPLHHVHDVMRYLAEQNRFHYLDLLPAFQKCLHESPERLAHDSYHPTARGHLCAAAATARRIERLRSGNGAGDAMP